MGTARLAGICIACGACASDREVHVTGEPHLAIVEGAELDKAVWITPSPHGLTEDQFTVAVEPALADRFTDLVVRADGSGGFQLHLQPDCDIATAAGSAFVPIAIGTEPPSLARPADVMLEVAQAPDASGCRPQVRTWLDDPPSDCSAPKTTPFVLARGHSATLCATFANQDPSVPLFLQIDENQAPLGLSPCFTDRTAFTATRTCAISIAGNRDIVGSFKFPYELALGAFPGTSGATKVLDGFVQLSVGQTDDIGVEITRVPGMVPEAAAKEFDLTVYYFQSGLGIACTVSAQRKTTPAGAMPRTKPFLALYDDAHQKRVGPGETIDCSRPQTQLRLRVSPPIDAAAMEGVTFAAFAGSVSKSMSPDLMFGVTSVADQLTCGAAGSGVAPKLACADVDGDGLTPEVVAIGATTCVFSGANGRIDSAPLALAGPAPLSVLGFAWAGQAVILARFAPGPDRIRRLVVTGGTAAWDIASAAPLGFVDNDDGLDLDRAQPIAATRGAPATELAYLKLVGTQPAVATRCLCASAAPQSIAIGNPGDALDAIARVDLDGDGVDDLLISLRTATGLDVYAVPVHWAARPVLGVPAKLGSLPGAPTFAAAGAQQIFAIDDDAFGARLRTFTGAAPVASWTDIAAPGATRALVDAGGRIVAGLSSGLTEYRPQSTSWMLQDPVLREATGQPTTDPLYGRALAACAGAPGVVLSTADNQVRYTQLDVVVEDP